MKDGALLVNAARGTVVDTAALVAEVASGRLRAALDVTDPEPLPPGPPAVVTPGVFITPHVAASTPVSRRRAAQLVREQAAGVPARRTAQERDQRRILGAAGTEGVPRDVR